MEILDIYVKNYLNKHTAITEFLSPNHGEPRIIYMKQHVRSNTHPWLLELLGVFPAVELTGEVL